jgi:hypothetical protein
MKVEDIITSAAKLRTECTQRAVLLANGAEWRKVLLEIHLLLILLAGNFVDQCL